MTGKDERKIFNNGEVFTADAFNQSIRWNWVDPDLGDLLELGDQFQLGDEALSGAPGSLKGDFRNFQNAFAVNATQGLTVFYNAGAIRIKGQIFVIPAGSITLPNNNNTYLYVNASGAIAFGSDYPQSGFVIALIQTLNGAVNPPIKDFRDRNLYTIDTAGEINNLKLIGSLEHYYGAIPGNGFIQQGNYFWVPLTSDFVRTLGNVQSGSSISAAWAKQLFFQLFSNSPNLAVADSTGRTSNRPATAQVAWDNQMRLTLPDLRNAFLRGSDSETNLASNKGSSTVSLTLSPSQVPLPSHSHVVVDPTHTHAISDPKHAHSFYDPGHAHSLNDPGHAHAISDPRHTHGLNLAMGGTFGYGGGKVAVNQDGSGNVQEGDRNSSDQGIDLINHDPTDSSPTGIGIYGSSTGLGVNSIGTGGGVYSSYTGVSANPVGTGISLLASAQSASSPVSFAVDPYSMLVHVLIFAGGQ